MSSRALTFIYGLFSLFTSLTLSITITCTPGEDCYVDCDTSCKSSTINCPDNYNCYINATIAQAIRWSTINGGNGGNLILQCDYDNSCDGASMTINCPTNGDCNITSIGGNRAMSEATINAQNVKQLNVYGTGSWAFYFTRFYCPVSYIPGPDVKYKCNIRSHAVGVGSAFSPMRDARIYAIEGLTDVNLYCSRNANDCGWPYIYCDVGYTKYCLLTKNGSFTNYYCYDSNAGCAQFTFPPTETPSSTPTATPSQPPTMVPSQSPTQPPSSNPSQPPSIVPSISPTQPPSVYPSNNPSVAPSLYPTIAPSNTPSQPPTADPSNVPTIAPSVTPTYPPSITPSDFPSLAPSNIPSQPPSNVPTISPSSAPSITPTNFPSNVPSSTPTQPPSMAPSLSPTLTPSKIPSLNPSIVPSQFPSINPSLAPSIVPSLFPSVSPTDAPSFNPSNAPTMPPSSVPSEAPSIMPSIAPSVAPSKSPSETPTNNPSISPSLAPSVHPTSNPTEYPSISPSETPTLYPTNTPSNIPTMIPTTPPSSSPTIAPSDAPINAPSQSPIAEPSESPSSVPSDIPTVNPSNVPSDLPSAAPTLVPTVSPSKSPTSASSQPTLSPTYCFEATYINKISVVFNRYNNILSHVLLSGGQSIISSSCKYLLLFDINLILYDMRRELFYTDGVNKYSEYLINKRTNISLDINAYNYSDINDIRLELSLQNISIVISILDTELVVWNESFNDTDNVLDAYPVNYKSDIELTFEIKDNGDVFIYNGLHFLWQWRSNSGIRISTTDTNAVSSDISSTESINTTGDNDGSNVSNWSERYNYLWLIIILSLFICICLICCVKKYVIINHKIKTQFVELELEQIDNVDKIDETAIKAINKWVVEGNTSNKC